MNATSSFWQTERHVNTNLLEINETMNSAPNEGHESEFKVFFAADDQVIKVVLCSDVNYAHTLLR